MYRIKEKIAYNQLPSSFIASYADADGSALKVALYFLAHEKATMEELVSNLPLSERSVERSLQYWEENGFIIKNNETVSALSSKRISHDEMSKAVMIDPNVSVLLQESQQILGRELPLSESRLLLEIYQTYLPSVYAILSLESYWSSKVPNKKVLHETLYSAREWNNLDIHSEEEYENQIRIMEKHDKYIKEIAEILSVSPESFSRKEKKTIITWLDDFSYDSGFVSEVLLRKPDAGIPYINSVMKNWHIKGYKSIIDTRDVPTNISDNTSGNELSPLFATILKKQLGK